MAVTNAQELLKHELGDLLYAEKQILKALKPMIRETSHPELKQRLEEHHGETEQQIQNLERAFEAMGMKPRGQKCPGILGILEEKKEFKDEEEPSAPMLEAFNLGAGLRVEHYEIAAYRSAMSLAKSLRQKEVADLLKQNLDQEVAMAKFIDSVSATALRQVEQALAMEQAEEGNGAARGRSGSARGTRSGNARSGNARSSGSRGARGARGGRGTKRASRRSASTSTPSAASA
ncbi:MAG TPA: ferritin-like domain-containing protein [Gemmatimonadaceae bacterium]|nr:ferritin-like domain-containing protein [Gemmatimonadaceae bacterium]